jgi:hypothetical protein
MSEALLVEPPLQELLRPTVTPEMGFQSYSVLGGEKAQRTSQKNAFLAGSSCLPQLDYPELFSTNFDGMIRSLDDILDRSGEAVSPEAHDAIWNSTAYRMAELHLMKSYKQILINRTLLPRTRFQQLVLHTQDQNEQLYGRPEQSVDQAIHAEIWTQIHTKEFEGDIAATLLADITHGTELIIDDHHVLVPPFEQGGEVRLPEIPSELLKVLKDLMYEKNGDLYQMIQEYWDKEISDRPEDTRYFTNEEVATIFERAVEMRDPEGASGVRVIRNEQSTALSWETPEMAVSVGMMRSYKTNPIASPESMFAKVCHEFVVHGGRAIEGGKSDIPVLGTGLFEEADPGEMTDYLSFEEGLAGFIEHAIDGEQREWVVFDMERTLALSLAYKGLNFRQVSETLWRVRALMQAKNGVPLTQMDVDKARAAAYDSTVRIFRGTPTEMERTKPDGTHIILTYNKDLAYLKGKLQMIEFWSRYKNSSELPEIMDCIFSAKIDPLNHRMLRLARAAKRP